MNFVPGGAKRGGPIFLILSWRNTPGLIRYFWARGYTPIGLDGLYTFDEKDFIVKKRETKVPGT
jgi:hypothetical protein